LVFIRVHSCNSRAENLKLIFFLPSAIIVPLSNDFDSLN
jgi:hypothetical protein